MLQESVVHPPHPELRPYVAAAVGYRHEGLPPGLHRGLPSPFLTLVVTLDGPLVMAAHPDPRQAPGSFDALIGGLHTRPALIAHPGHQCGIQLSLTPLGARALMGVPAGALASTDCHLADVIGPVGVELTEWVRTAADWPGRFAALETGLRRLVRADAALSAEVAEAWRLTTAAGGRLRVDDIARRIGWSPRHLADRFRAEIGLTPKEAARTTRFDRARRALATRVSGGGSPDLAGLAAGFGYYDQAHLTREWRALAGLPPARWLAEDVGFVQDAAALAAAPSSA